MTTRRIQIARCGSCQREFRGVNPRPLRDRHQAEERATVVLAVSTGAN